MLPFSLSEQNFFQMFDRERELKKASDVSVRSGYVICVFGVDSDVLSVCVCVHVFVHTLQWVEPHLPPPTKTWLLVAGVFLSQMFGALPTPPVCH